MVEESKWQPDFLGKIWFICNIWKKVQNGRDDF